MACYHPIRGYRSKDGPNKQTGKWPIVFDIKDGYSDMAMDLPCGQCIGCRLERSRQWAVRCIHEASLHKHNCFITLTYSEMPPGETLNKEDFPLFMKRLRKKYGPCIRFFQCGEYGSKCAHCGLNKNDCLRLGCRNFKTALGRPHHHAIIFNFDFSDKILFKSKPTPLYISPELQGLWKYGFSTVGAVTFESAAYVARYITKKVNGPQAPDHYQGKQPEYITMSRRPGIAHEWFQRYKNDVYPNDYVVIRNGIKCRPPSYYDKLYDLTNAQESLYVKYRRRKHAREDEDNKTVQRLEVREQIQQLKANQLIRPL